MPPELPQELLDKIIDNLIHDSKALALCALASRSLLFRSQGHLFATVCVSRLTQWNHLCRLLYANTALAGHVRELGLMSLDDWIDESTELPVILQKMMSLQSLCIASVGNAISLEWKALSREIADAFASAFRKPSLQHLQIMGIFGIPITFFHRDMKLGHLSLLNVSFKGYDDGGTQNLDVVPVELRLQHDLEIKCLSLGSVYNAISHAPQLLNATRVSLSTLQLWEWLAYAVRRQTYFTYNFNTSPTLHSLEFYIVVAMQLHDLQPLLRIASQNIIDFIIANPSAARIARIRICFIPLNPEPRPFRSPGSSLVSHAVEAVHLYGELDRVLDTQKEAVSTLSRLEVDLGVWSSNEQQSDSLIAHRAAWREKIHAKLPLASRRGVLFTEVIPDMGSFAEPFC